tara:strand:+ start:1428 stop:1622 length:195 start_codon:yes stop_codon:yes gene_type:complete
MYVNFTVSTGVVKNANRLLINSNKLNNVFYNVGKTFTINDKDMSEVKKILTRNFINLRVNKIKK